MIAYLFILKHRDLGDIIINIKRFLNLGRFSVLIIFIDFFLTNDNEALLDEQKLRRNSVQM